MPVVLSRVLAVFGLVQVTCGDISRQVQHEVQVDFRYRFIATYKPRDINLQQLTVSGESNEQFGAVWRMLIVGTEVLAALPVRAALRLTNF